MIFVNVSERNSWIMANHVVSDLGETVLAIGSEDSQARVLQQYPKLLSELTCDNYYQLLREFSGTEAKSLLQVSGLYDVAETRFYDLSVSRGGFVSNGLDPELWDEYNWLDSVL